MPTPGDSLVGNRLHVCVGQECNNNCIFCMEEDRQSRHDRMAGQTDDVLNPGSVSLADAGSYRVIVTNVAGAATSTVAVLIVQAPPVITAHPRGGFAAIGYPCRRRP